MLCDIAGYPIGERSKREESKNRRGARGRGKERERRERERERERCSSYVT